MSCAQGAQGSLELGRELLLLGQVMAMVGRVRRMACGVCGMRRDTSTGSGLAELVAGCEAVLDQSQASVQPALPLCAHIILSLAGAAELGLQAPQPGHRPTR